MCCCRYGDVHPVFYIGSLDDALREALQCKARDVSLSNSFQKYIITGNIHCESIKHDTKLLFMSLPNIS